MDDINKGELFFDRMLKAVLILTVFLLPLFYFLSSDVIGFSKALLLSVLALLALFAWVGKVVAGGTLYYRRVWFVWPAAITGLIVLAGLIISSAPWVSFLGAAGRAEFSAVSVLSYLIIFLAALNNLRRKDAVLLLYAAVGSVALASLASLLQFLGVFVFPGEFARTRLFNPVGSIFALSLFAAFSLPLIIEFLNRARRAAVKVLLAVAGLVQLFLVLVVNFRIVWLVLALSLLAYLALVSFKQGFFSRDWRAQKRITIPLVLLVVSLLLWILPNVPGPRLTGAPAEVVPSYSASFEVVRGVWGSSVVGALLGGGPETFPYNYARLKSPALNATNFWGVNFNNANAEILTFAANHGLLGTLVWLIFAGGFLVAAVRLIRLKEESFLEIGILAAWLFVVISKFFYPTPLALEIFFWVLPVIFLVYAGGEKTELRTYEFRSGSVLVVAAFISSVLLIMVSAAGLYLTAQRWIGEYAYAKAVSSEFTQENKTEIINRLSTAVSLNPYEARYWLGLTQGIIGEINDIFVGAQERQLNDEETARLQNITVAALNALERARSLDPENTNLLGDVGESYQIMSGYVSGAIDLAISSYERAVELEPVNPFFRTRLAQFYLTRDNFFLNRELRQSDGIAKAKRQLEKALDLNQNYSNARYFMGFILEREGNRPAALEQFRIVLEFNPENQAVAVIVRNLENGIPALGPPQPQGPENAPVGGEEAEGVPE